MIEFRWLTRYIEFTSAEWEAYCERYYDPSPPRPVERALQVRMREGPRGEDWWGKWSDVPEVDGR